MRWLIALLFCACSTSQTPPTPQGPLVGFASRLATDPVGGQPLKIAVFFPPQTMSAFNATHVGAYWVEAAEAIPQAGTHPLIVISHGHGGGRLGHHDLAEALARAGNIVAAVEHSGDSYADPSRFASDKVLLGRAWQVSATITELLADPLLGPLIDPQRIGVAGFSAGGYTALTLIGAKPEFERWAGYCKRHPTDTEFCVGQKKVKLTISDPAPTYDARVKAALVMAPLGIYFGESAFNDVTAPVQLWWAENDSVLARDENLDPVKSHLASMTDFEEIKAADHWVFIAPCSAALEADAPRLCADPPGVDRRAVHRQLAERAVRFFNDSLH